MMTEEEAQEQNRTQRSVMIDEKFSLVSKPEHWKVNQFNDSNVLKCFRQMSETWNGFCISLSLKVVTCFDKRLFYSRLIHVSVLSAMHQGDNKTTFVLHAHICSMICFFPFGLLCGCCMVFWHLLSLRHTYIRTYPYAMCMFVCVCQSEIASS